MLDVMTPRILALALLLAPLPGMAQQSPEAAPGLPEGIDLMQRGMQTILEGLFSEMQPALDEMERALSDLRPMAEQLLRLVDDIGNYEAPVILENGDILIRRKPPVLGPPKDGEVDL
jgi:hypothetical protein